MLNPKSICTIINKKASCLVIQTYGKGEDVYEKFKNNDVETNRIIIDNPHDTAAF
jgi:hypothetical protein